MKSARAVLILCLLAISLLVVLTAWQARENNRLRDRVAELEQAVQAEKLAETEATARLARELELAKAEMEARQTALEATPAPVVPPQAVQRGARTEDSDLFSDMAKIIEDNPAMGEMIAAQQRSTLEQMYRRLAGRYEFAPDEEKYFYDLLLARQMQRVNLGLKLMGGKVSPEERDAMMADIRDAEARMKEDMAAFLNRPEDMETFSRYESTLGERMELEGFARQAATAGEPFSDEQFEAIVGQVHDLRASYPYTNRFNNDDGDFSQLTDANIARYIDESRLANDQIRASLTPSLSATQLQLFQQNQEQMLSLQAAQLKMAAKMFANPAPTPAE